MGIDADDVDRGRHQSSEQTMNDLNGNAYADVKTSWSWSFLPNNENVNETNANEEDEYRVAFSGQYLGHYA